MSEAREAGIALCLSGGGYRAMLFHVGAIWRLNELGLLRALRRISSVSGGSITAGMLGLAWGKLAFDRSDVATEFIAQVVSPLRALARETIDVEAALLGLLPGIRAGNRIEAAYRTHLFGDATLTDLPADTDGPRFVINASNVQTGALWRFSRPYMGDWRVGRSVATHKVSLAMAVAASSAFPPVLSPVVLHLEPSDFIADEGSDIADDAFKRRIVLTDGGVYDNLGLETVDKRFDTVLVSDGGAAFVADASPHLDWPRHAIRSVELVMNQAVAQRKRQLIHEFIAEERHGTYWGIRSDLAAYVRDRTDLDPIEVDRELVLRLAATPTRLAELDETHQIALVNWGYIVCDAAIRTYLRPDLPRPVRPPY